MTAPLPTAPDHADRVAALVAALRSHRSTAVVCTSLLAAAGAIDGVGLTVFTTAGRFVVGTAGVPSDRVEDLQITLDQGPCMDAYDGGEPVLADDLTDDEAVRRWPKFAAQAVTAGVRGVFAFPVLLDGRPVAVLSLCRTTPGGLSPGDYQHAVTHAAAAAVLLHDDANASDAESLGAAVEPAAADLQQATGMVMVQADVDATTALHRLRAHAFAHDRPVHDIVAEILGRRLRFDPAAAS